MRFKARNPRALACCVVLLVACAEQTADMLEPPISSDGGNQGAGGAGGAGAAGKNVGGSPLGGSAGSTNSAGTSGSSTAGSSSGGTSGGSSAGSSNGGTGGTITTGDGGDGGTDSGGSSSGGSSSGGSSSGGSSGTSGSSGSGGSSGSSGKGGSSGCSENEVTLQATADAFIQADSATMNYGNTGDVWVKRWGSGYSMRGLVRFDLSGIPSAADVMLAELTLTMATNSGHDKTVAVHRVQQSPARNWSETQVTWNVFSSGNNWSAAGGDFVSGASDSTDIDEFDTSGETVVWDVTADAADFVQTPAENYGWLLKDTAEPAGGAGQSVAFASRTHGTSSWRPKLTVQYCE